MVALQISPKIESLYGLGRQIWNFATFASSHLDNFPQKTLKLGRVAFHSLTFQFDVYIFNLINITNSAQCPHVSAMDY